MDKKQKNERRAKRGAPSWSRWAWLGASLLLLAGVVLTLLEVEDTVEVSRSDTPAVEPVVSVQAYTAQTTQAEVSVFTEVQPRWDVDLKAAVSGRIIRVFDGALAGARVKKGDPLFTIENAQYAANVSAAQTALEEAELALLHAENKVTLARRQFARDKIKPPTELSLWLPQLRVAKKKQQSAKAQLESAQRVLNDAAVTAPFSGIVTQRSANLGQMVNPGDNLLHLKDDQQFELVAEISKADWGLLNHPISGGIAQLYLQDGTLAGQARIRDGGGFLDDTTRQVKVFLEVIDPNTSILAGDFLRVSIPGRKVTDTLILPESAISRAGYIWLVNKNDLLERMRPEVLFRSTQGVTIKVPEGTGPWRVAKTPLAFFLPGQKVTPRLVGG